jgi:1-phosphatidylinositol-4-phosphate 5-kinase
MLFKSGESQGKSGSFFFFSHDQEFIIKTMFKDEFDIFMKAVPDYYEYLRFKPKSIIARIYGVFQVIMSDLSPIYLLVMGNTIKVNNKENIINIFDLKGSIVNREVHNTKTLKKTSTLKDINFLKKKKEYSDKNIVLISFNEKDIELLNNQVKQDI